MKGIIIVDEKGVFFVEYLTTGIELDEVEKKRVRLSFFDRNEVSVGEEIEFEINDSYRIDNKEIATIKR